MANRKFEGDLSNISERQLEFVSSVLEERGYKNDKVVVSAVGKVGDNYVATVKRFVVEKDGETFKMVGKVAPINEFVRASGQMQLIFYNEHVMYTEVLPKLTELEKGADIPQSERLRYATCYGSLTEAPYEIILLEDLQVSDFVMLDRLVSFTNENVKLILRSFAILHSACYALKQQEIETFTNYKNKLVNNWALMSEVEEFKKYFEHLENDVISILDNNEHKRIVKGSLTKLPILATKYYKIDKESKHAIIQQGDAWTNNILFRLQDHKGVECCMIDYQLSNSNSPVADIHYMTFNCTDYATRSKHYHEWIDYYHGQLEERLANFGLKVNAVYPRDQLDADLKRLAKVPFGLSIMLASMLMRESHEVVDFKDAFQHEVVDIDAYISETKLSTMSTSTLDRFKTRVEGLIDSFIELGYL